MSRIVGAGSAKRWFVVSTKVRQEKVAQQHLARRGVESFLPWILDPRPRRPTVAPLFPGYLFLRLDLFEQYFDVIWTPGVRKFVTFGSWPCPMDEAVLEFLRARIGPEGILRPVRVLSAGDTVRVCSGPFAGLEGIIENPGSSGGRIRVLMQLLRRHTPVELPVDIVERVSA